MNVKRPFGPTVQANRSGQPFSQAGIQIAKGEIEVIKPQPWNHFPPVDDRSNNR